jgi:hypothetical protein
MDVMIAFHNGLIEEEVYINREEALRCMGGMPMYIGRRRPSMG